MGRPFVSYDDEEVLSGELHSPEAWMAAAHKALADDGCALTPPMAAALSHILSTRRLTFTPNCQPAPSGGLELLDSKIGGLPFLLPTESWPVDATGPLCHLWQQRVQDLPTAVKQALGHTTGLLQVFVSEELEVDGGDYFLVRVLADEQLVARRRDEVVPPPEVTVLDEQRVVSYTAVYDFPVRDDVLDGLPGGMSEDAVESILADLQDAGLYHTVPGDKLLGWPNWCQGPEWCLTGEDEHYMQVVQIEGNVSGFVVGDSGTLLLQRHPEDPAVWSASWACC